MLCPLLATLVAPEIITPFCETCRAPVSEPLLMGALVNRVMTVFVGTPVAPLPGRMLSTLGAVFRTAVVVVNWLVVLASAFGGLARSLIRFVAVTVSVAPAGRIELL